MPHQRGAITKKGTEAIARRLARLRREGGITQQMMAQKIGISQRVFSGYERGELRLHGELILQITKILKVSTDELLGAKKERSASKKVSRLVNRLRQIERLPPTDQKAVLKFADALLQNRGLAKNNGQRRAS